MREAERDEWAKRAWRESMRFLTVSFWLTMDMFLMLIVAGELTFIQRGMW